MGFEADKGLLYPLGRDDIFHEQVQQPRFSHLVDCLLDSGSFTLDIHPRVFPQPWRRGDEQEYTQWRRHGSCTPVRGNEAHKWASEGEKALLSRLLGITEQLPGQLGEHVGKRQQHWCAPLAQCLRQNVALWRWCPIRE